MSKNDAVSDAKHYLAHIQEREARKSGFEPLWDGNLQNWLSVHSKSLSDVTNALGLNSTESANLLSAYAASMSNLTPESIFDDLNCKLILKRIVEEIENACTEMNIPTHGGVVYGAVPSLDLSPAQSSVFGSEVSMITAPQPFIILCNLIARTMANSLPVEETSEGWVVKNDIASVRDHFQAKHELISQWRSLIESFARYDYPPYNNLSETPSGASSAVRIQLLRAVEVFAVAHEYGHHVFEHGKHQPIATPEEAFSAEYEADIFAQCLVIQMAKKDQRPNGTPNFYALFGTGALLIFRVIEMTMKAKCVLLTGKVRLQTSISHPATELRMENLSLLDELLPARLRVSAPIMRSEFEAILDYIWQRLLPEFEVLHLEGVRQVGL